MKKKCPYCYSECLVKDGIVRGKQRYRCKKCLKRTSTFKLRGKPLMMKENAIRLYLEGLGLRSIARFLNVSQVTIMKWVKVFAKALPEPEKPESVQIMELDEMYHWIGSKKTKYGSGLRFAVLPVESSPMKWVVVEKLAAKTSGRS